MKRIVAVVLLCGVMLTCFSGCEDILDYIWPQNTTVPPADDAALVTALTDYLWSLQGFIFPYEHTPRDGINIVKHYEQPALHVAFDESNSYFMCGYYSDEHEQEGKRYCCADKYEWVKYESVDKIQEYHNGKKMVVSFQVNCALFVKALVPRNAELPRIEYYQMYAPTFVDGINVGEQIAFEKSLIYVYMKKPKAGYLYFDNSRLEDSRHAIPCVNLNGEYYVRISFDEGDSEVEKNFGEYYATLKRIMEEEVYEDETGRYKLVKLDVFVRRILK